MSSLSKVCSLFIVLAVGVSFTQCANYRYKEKAPAVNDPAVSKRDNTKQSNVAPMQQKMNTVPAATE